MAATPEVYMSMREELVNLAKEVQKERKNVKSATTIADIVESAKKLGEAYENAKTKFNGTDFAKNGKIQLNGYTIEMNDVPAASLKLVKADKYSKDFSCNVTKSGSTGYYFVPADNTLYFHDDLTTSTKDVSRSLSSIAEEDDKDDIYDVLKMARQMYVNAI